MGGPVSPQISPQVEIARVKRSTLHYIILELNSALDSGKYDEITVRETAEGIRGAGLVGWMRTRVHSVGNPGRFQANPGGTRAQR